MRNMLLAGVFSAAFGVAPVGAATLVLQVFDNGVSVGTTVSTTGSLHFVDTTAPGFSSISVDANGPPFLTNADLTSTTLDISAFATTAPHTLILDLYQVGVASNGNTDSTFSVNHLLGSSSIGPAVLSTFFDGTTSALGTPLAHATFPTGTVVDTIGPLAASVGSFTSDAQQYVIPFAASALPQSADDTIELKTAIPEPSTWAMLALGMGFLGFVAMRKRKAPIALA